MKYGGNNELTSSDEIWKDIIKVGVILGGSLWMGQKINETVINYNRKETSGKIVLSQIRTIYPIS